ncbi:MAG: M3 family metallopeptidase [Bryobacteraceae bacterium]
MTTLDNPLLNLGFEIPFDRIRAGHVEPAIEELLKEAAARLEEIASFTGERTFENTMLAIDHMTESLDTAMSVVRHLESVATYPELREAYNKIQEPVSAFYASIPLHEGLWNAVKDYAETEEARNLTGVRQRFLRKTIDSFRRHGAELDAAGKARLSEIDVELARLTTKFSQNVLDSTNAFELILTDETKLAGLPPSAIAAARESAESKGKPGWRFTLQQPSYHAVMTYLDDPAIREHVYRAHSTRAASGEFDNRPLIVKILALRREKANLLGYRDFADLVLEDRMAGSGERAWRFLQDLKQRTVPHFVRETDALLRFRRELEGPQAPELQAWDVAYYAEKERAALFDFDEEDLRPYFPLAQVVEGMFELTRRLFGIRVVQKSGVPAWHPETLYYEIQDEDGALLGAFYADWHPRETKRGGAWMDAFVTGHPEEGRFTPHLGLICGNLTPPVRDTPALVTHREVETVFHEFGHLIHHCLSRVEIRSLSGTSVPWDFVELPSQIMENWCWERESLDLFARHYATGEPIPGDLFQKMRRARTFRAASAQMRQLSFGIADLALHREYSPDRHGDVIAWTREILQGFSPAPLPPEHAMLAGFTHLFSSPVAYAAGYYSYKWSEVLDADAFTRFRKAGIFSADVGREYREWILSKGDSEDPAELYRRFMGRDPDLTALLERQGLVPAT